MRRRLEAMSRGGKWIEVLALIAGAVIVVVAVGALDHSGRSHGRGPSMDAGLTDRRSHAFADSPAGAAEVATASLGLLVDTAAGDSAGAGARLTAITTGSLRAELRQSLPQLARALRVRLASTAAPSAFNGWPLGYRVTDFNAARATVSVWHLDLAASSALALMTVDYATTTYQVRWVDGTWRIAHASIAAGPTPPPSDAPPASVDRFAAAARQFSPYRYVP
jgi:hypothetical protein